MIYNVFALFSKKKWEEKYHHKNHIKIDQHIKIREWRYKKFTHTKMKQLDYNHNINTLLSVYGASIF